MIPKVFSKLISEVFSVNFIIDCPGACLDTLCSCSHSEFLFRIFHSKQCPSATSTREVDAEAYGTNKYYDGKEFRWCIQVSTFSIPAGALLQLIENGLT